MFIPPIIGDAARAESEDAHTGKTISLMVAPAGVRDASPDGAVMTFALPGMRAFLEFAQFSFQKIVHLFDLPPVSSPGS